MTIINLTKIAATTDQAAIGVTDLTGSLLTALRAYMLVPDYADEKFIKNNANQLASIAYSAWDEACQKAADSDDRHLCPTDDAYMDYWYHSPKEVIIGGAQSLMPFLEDELMLRGFRVGYYNTVSSTIVWVN